MEAVAQSGKSSIVTGEPYRYACEECGSVAVTRINHDKREQGRTFQAGGAGRVAANESREEQYRCKVCRHRSDTVYDKKLESCVAP